MKPVNPKWFYPGFVFSFVLPGILLTINYLLLREKALARIQFLKLSVWIFLFFFVGIALESVSQMLVEVAYFAVSLVLTHIWIRQQYQVYVKSRYEPPTSP